MKDFKLYSCTAGEINVSERTDGRLDTRWSPLVLMGCNEQRAITNFIRNRLFVNIPSPLLSPSPTLLQWLRLLSFPLSPLYLPIVHHLTLRSNFKNRQCIYNVFDGLGLAPGNDYAFPPQGYCLYQPLVVVHSESSSGSYCLKTMSHWCFLMSWILLLCLSNCLLKCIL